MSFFLDFIGGAAQAHLGIIERKEKEAQQEKFLELQANLEIKKQEAIEALRANRERQSIDYQQSLKDKPLNDYAAAVAKRSGEQVPAEPPAPVTSTSGITDRSSMVGVDGNPIQSAGAGDVGLSGDLAKLRQQIMNDPGISNEDRKGALAQLDAQAAQQNQANAAAAPKTRSLSQSEAQDLAMQDLLKAGNGPAYVAGRPLQNEKTLSVADGAAIIDPKTGKVLFQNSGKADRQREHEDFQTRQRQDEQASKEKLERLRLDPLGVNSAANGESAGKAAQAISDGVTGEEFLTTVSKPVAEQVRALAAGRMSFPTGQAIKTPYWQSVLTLVSQYDPTFDAVNYGTRAATRKAFTSGREASSVNALNTVLGHLDSLGVAADKLNNGAFPHINTATNFLESSIGDARVKKFEATKKAVVDELTRAWRGSGGAVSDIETWSKTLDASNSPEQLHGVIGQLGDLLDSKIEALNDQYRKGMGKTSDGFHLMSPHAAEVLQRIKKRAGMDTEPKAATPSAGGTLTYDPSTGTFH